MAKRGRPTDEIKDKTFQMRVSEKWLVNFQRFAISQNPMQSVSEAIRDLVGFASEIQSDKRLMRKLDAMRGDKSRSEAIIELIEKGI